MENFLKIYIQKIQQNLKAVAFLTIQFFRERADFSNTKKTSRKEFSTMQYPTETWIEYPLLSFFFESNFFGLKVPFMFDFAVCLPWLSIFFSFFISERQMQFSYNFSKRTWWKRQPMQKSVIQLELKVKTKPTKFLRKKKIRIKTFCVNFFSEKKTN